MEKTDIIIRFSSIHTNTTSLLCFTKNLKTHLKNHVFKGFTHGLFGVSPYYSLMRQ